MAAADTQIRDRLAQAYDAYATGLYRYFLSFGFDEGEARDGLQEVFVRLAAKPRVLEEARSRRAVLFRIAHNYAVDQVRRREVRRKGDERLRVLQFEGDDASGGLFPKTMAIDTAVDGAEFRRHLAQAFSQLPGDQASVVQLKLWQGLTFAEIAEVQDIGQNTVGSRYRYGIDKLRALLRPLYEEIR